MSDKAHLIYTLLDIRPPDKMIIGGGMALTFQNIGCYAGNEADVKHAKAIMERAAKANVQVLNEWLVLGPEDVGVDVGQFWSTEVLSWADACATTSSVPVVHWFPNF